LKGLFGEDHEQGWNRQETSALQAITTSTSRRNSGGCAGPASEDVALLEMAMVRDDTDLLLPEEDILVQGGTGENEALNGLYFKLSNTYGQPVYKMAKKQGAAGAVHARYLFKDPKSSCWVIAPRPDAGIATAPGCAFADGEGLDRPTAAKSGWHVWYPPTRSMRCGDEPQDSTKAGKKVAPIDTLSVGSVVGFEVLGSQGTELQTGLMLRHAGELYSRPIYEAEDGSQFLYWMKDGGTLVEGMEEEDEHDAAEHIRHAQLLATKGRWVFARTLGEAPEGPGCLAYAEDAAATPHTIGEGTVWYALKSNPDGPNATFKKCPGLRLVAEEWMRNLSLLDSMTFLGGGVGSLPGEAGDPAGSFERADQREQ